MILVFDIGGTSSKVVVLNNKRTIIARDIISYPNNDLIDADLLSQLVKQQIQKLIKIYPITTICFSTCGVISDDGSISGLYAIKNYDKINWKRDLQSYQIPIYVENDGNCALLAEQKYGVAQGYSNIISLVLGTGIGGAIIVNNQILKGLSGEFGCFLERIEDKQYINLSQTASPRNLELKLNSILQQTKSLKDYLLVSYDNNPTVKRIVDETIFILAKNIVNLSFTINPEIFVIGGGISANDWFINHLNGKIDELMKMINMKRTWKVVAAKFKNDANILGAYSLCENKLK